MKKCNLVILLIWLLAWLQVPAFAQSGWTQRNQQPSNGDYLYAHIADSNRVIAFGLLMNRHAVTVNGGNFWSMQTSMFPQALNASLDLVHFPTPSLGFMCNFSDTLYRTSDSGFSWQKSNLRNVYGIVFANGQNGMCAATNPANGANIFRRSTDGGQSWTVTSSNQRRYMLMASRNANEYWALAGMAPDMDTSLYRTTNSGTTWSKVNVGSSQTMTDVFFLNDQLGWAVGQRGFIAKTTNGGQTWTNRNIDLGNQGNGFFKFITFITAQRGFGTTFEGTTLLTTDGGDTWSQLSIEGSVNSISFLNQNIGWAVGAGGLIYKTTDSGSTWNKQTDGFNVSFLSGGDVIGNRIWLSTNGTPFWSDDKGVTWQRVDSLETPRQALQGRTIQFVKNGIGYMASGGVFKTTNGGKEWKLKNYDLATVMSLNFPSVDTGYIVDFFGAIYKTTDGGNSWPQILASNPPTVSNQYLKFLSPNIGFRAYDYSGNGPNGGISKTTDGGANWTSINPFPPNTYVSKINAFDFYDELNGWATMVLGGTNFAFCRTTDGGLTWASTTNFNQRFVQMKFVSPTVGYAIGNDLYKTTDGGTTWIPTQIDPSFGRYTGFIMKNDKPIVVYGDFGAVYTANDWSNNSLYYAKGKVVKKQNDDCIVDANETGLANRFLVAQPGNYFSSSDEKGNYLINLDPGIYQISQIPRSVSLARVEKQICPNADAPLSASISSLIDTNNTGNFINEVVDCGILTVSQQHFLIRPCVASRLNITVLNEGNIVSEANSLIVKLHRDLHFVSASRQSTFNALDSSHRFQLPPIPPGGKFELLIIDSATCEPNRLTNQILCVKTSIANTPLCMLGAVGWDGSDLEVASACRNNTTRFTIRNKGMSMAQTSTYRIYVDTALVYQFAFQLSANNQMTVTLPPNTPPGTSRLEVAQTPNHPLTRFASAEANCSDGSSTNGLFPQNDESPLVDVACVQVTNSFDPNDKLVLPKGVGPLGNIEPGTEMKYTIRFQNTGNDTAFNVVIVDTLSNHFDLSTFKPGTASHPYRLEVTGKGRPVLNFVFRRIMLPDSNRNEPGSHGMVSFTIKHKADLPLGTSLENFADIYFDFNDPIKTNTTLNTLWRQTITPGFIDTTLIVTANKQEHNGENTLRLVPNPASGLVTLFVPKHNEGMDIRIVDTKGSLAKQLKAKTQTSIQIGDLQPGIYSVMVPGLKPERLVVNH